MEIKLITELDKNEKEWWKNTIKDFRLKFVREPKEYAQEIIKKEELSVNKLEEDIETSIESTREKVWQLYLEDEAIFHKKVISNLIVNRELPRNILDSILQKDFFKLKLESMGNKDIAKHIAEIVGESAGRIMPYIYELSLSTTNSRRARAGRVFEQIIETFFDLYNYPYGNQSSIGNAAYKTKELSKKIDLIVPSVESYISNRSKTAVVTMKTSLRERWQEVAEELQRTNVPHIYLLTVDENVSANTVSIMSQYNITLVLYKREKDAKFVNFESVIDYDTFFHKELPHIISYWENK